MLSSFILQKPSWTTRINSADPFPSSACSKIIQIPWSHLPPTAQLPAWAGRPPSRLNSTFLQYLAKPKQGSFLLVFLPISRIYIPWLTYYHNKRTTKVPSKQDRDIQRSKTAWSFARESCLLSKLQSTAFFKRLLIQSQETVHAGVHPQSPWALPHQHQKQYSCCWQNGCVKTQRNSYTAHYVSFIKKQWDYRKAVAMTNIMAWASPYPWSSLSTPSSSGFPRIAPHQ